jgi:hypothetical protein
VSRFAFVAAERANHAVVTLYRIIGASVSGFYAWLCAIPTVRTRADAELRGPITRGANVPVASGIGGRSGAGGQGRRGVDGTLPARIGMGRVYLLYHRYLMLSSPTLELPPTASRL